MNTLVTCKWNNQIVMTGKSTRIFAYDMAKAYIRNNFAGKKVKDYLHGGNCPWLLQVISLHKDHILVFEFEDDTGSAQVTITAI